MGEYSIDETTGYSKPKTFIPRLYICGCQFFLQVAQMDMPSCEQPMHRDGNINSARLFMVRLSIAKISLNSYLNILGIILRLWTYWPATDLFASNSRQG
jgi:hypothetical protein